MSSGDGFYTKFLEKCLRDGKFSKSLPRKMTLNETDAYFAWASEIINGRMDLDSEVRLDLGVIKERVKLIESIVSAATIIHSQLSRDLEMCKEVYSDLSLFRSSGVLSKIGMFFASYCQKSDFNRFICEADVILGDNYLSSSDFDESISLSNLNMVEIVANKVLQNYAVSIFGEDGRNTPSVCQKQMFDDLCASHSSCVQLSSIGWKVNEISCFVLNDLRDVELSIEMAVSAGLEVGDVGLFHGNLLTLTQIFDTRLRVKSLLTNLACLDICEVKNELKSVMDYHSKKIVNNQVV